MNVIDPKRGTHFDGKKIVVTEHAIQRAVSRFDKKRSEAERWITDNLRKAAYVGEVVDEEGRERILYGYERIAFVVSKIDGAVITVYPQHHVTPTIRQKVEEIIARELRKARRKFERIYRDVELTKADLMVERAECYRRKLRTRSEAVRNAMEGRIRAIDEYCAQLDDDVAKVRRDNSALVKGVVAYL